MLLGVEGDGLGNDGAAFLCQGLFQKRVACLAQAEGPVLRDHRHPGAKVQCGAGLRHQEIYLSDEGGAGEQVRQVRADEVGEFQQDTLYLPGLCEAQLRKFVLEFYQFGRLDVGCLARGGFPVDEAAQLALGGTCNGDEVLPFAHRDPGVGIGQPGRLRLRENCRRFLGNGPLLAPEGLAYVEQGIGRGVLDIPVFVQYLLDAPLHFRENVDAVREPLQVRIYPVFDAGEEVHYAPGGVQHRFEFAQAEHVDARTVLFQGLQELDGIDVTGGGEGILEHQHQPHLVGQDQPAADDICGAAEFLFHHLAAGVVGAAAVGDHRADAVESDLEFQFLNALFHGLVFFLGRIQHQFQLVAAVHLGDSAVPHEGDGAALLAHHYHVRVAAFADAYCRFMPHPVFGGDVGAVGVGEGAAGCDNAVAAYYHRPVVKRGVLEKDVLYQAAADV